jgi:hypothetical protein
MALKHVGRLADSKKKVVIAYRVVPGEPDNCIIIPTETLDAGEHDSLMKLVESNAGQSANELAEAMSRTTLPDGRNMLAGLHSFGKMIKISTSKVNVTPDSMSSINLAELNRIVAEQKGVTVADLALAGPNGTVAAPAQTDPVDPTSLYANTSSADGVLTDEALAAQYRSQADAMYKEAKRLREQAEELVPTKRKTKTSAEEIK